MKRAPSRRRRSAPSPRTASEISGCWPVGSRAEPQHGRVELHELEVADLRPRAQRQGDAVARWRRRVGGDDEAPGPMPPVARITALASTAPTPSRSPSPMTWRVTPSGPVGHRRPAREQVDDEGVLDDLDARVAARHGARRAPAEISAPVASPPAWTMRSRVVPALAGQGDLAGRRVGRSGRRAPISSRTRVGALGDEHLRPPARRTGPPRRRACRWRCCLGGVAPGRARRRSRPAPRPWSPSPAGPW